MCVNTCSAPFPHFLPFQQETSQGSQCSKAPLYGKPGVSPPYWLVSTTPAPAPKQSPEVVLLSARGGRAGTHRLALMKEPGSGRKESVRPGGTSENISCSYHLCPSEQRVLRATKKLKCCLMLSINCQPEYFCIVEGHWLRCWRHPSWGGCGAASEKGPAHAA